MRALFGPSHACRRHCALCYAETIAMSQIFYDEISLADVVRSAGYVLLVRAADPPARTETIAIDRPSREGGQCPPFTMNIARYEVLEVLYARGYDDAEEPSGIVEVASANWELELDLHIGYYVNGMSKSPLYYEYKSRGRTNGDTALLFAVMSSRGLAFAAVGSLEDPSYIDEVRALLSRQGGDGLEEVFPDEETPVD